MLEGKEPTLLREAWGANSHYPHTLTNLPDRPDRSTDNRQAAPQGIISSLSSYGNHVKEPRACFCKFYSRLMKPNLPLSLRYLYSSQADPKPNPSQRESLY